VMASPKIQFSAGDLEADIKERAVLDDRSPSLVAQRDLRRYYRVLRASLLAHQHAVEAVRMRPARARRWPPRRVARCAWRKVIASPHEIASRSSGAPTTSFVGVDALHVRVQVVVFVHQLDSTG
jgi:hypothetical protein